MMFNQIYIYIKVIKSTEVVRLKKKSFIFYTFIVNLKKLFL